MPHRLPTNLLPALLLSSALATVATAPTAPTAQPLHHGAERYNPADLYRTTTPAAGSFDRMFDLDEFGLSPHPSPIYDLRRLGAPDGPMQETDPVGDSRIEAGITFLGQFVDHDVTLDVTSSLERRAIPEETPNVRTPDLDLDCVYGNGREADPWLYDGPFLVVGAPILGGARNDLARTVDTEVALIGDPRNDENFILSQVQAAFIAFHNRFTNQLVTEALVEAGELAPGSYTDAELRQALGALRDTMPASADPAAMAEAFEKQRLAAEISEESFEHARDHVIHYYHRMLVEYFLPKVIGVGRTIDIATNGRQFYLPTLTLPEDKGAGLLDQTPGMPVEFAAAAYRFGHSQVRQSYQLTAAGDPRDLFRERMQNGFAPVTDANALDFALFYPIRGRQDAPQPTRLLDPKLPEALFFLDRVGVVPPGGLGSLAARNLNRGRTFRLPPGEELFDVVTAPAVAGGDLVTVRSARRKAFTALETDWLRSGTRELREDELDGLRRTDGAVLSTLGLPATPLWYYVLLEASRWPVTFAVTPESHHVWPVERFIPRSSAFVAEALQRNGQAYRSTYEATHRIDRFERGQILGPVGGTIVGEVIIGLIDHYREKTGKGLDYIVDIPVELTELKGFGPRMTFGDMIVFIGWDDPLAP